VRRGLPAPGGSPLRVAHVSVVHAWDDPRIAERECRSLAEAGYEVALLVPGDVPPDPWHGVRLVGLPRRPRSTRWLTAREISTELHRLQPHVVHIHDPELLTLLPALRPFTPRLVYDMHEYVSSAVSTKHYIPDTLRPAAAGLTAAAQRVLAGLADGIVAVVPAQFDDLGERPRLRVAVPNYPRLERFADAVPLPDIAADPRLKLIYIGSLTRTRGVPVMLDVMREVGERAVLFLGGRFSNPEFEREVRELASGKLAHCLRLLGPVPPPNVPSLLAGCDVVWVPELATEQYRRPTVPSKLFEGMAVGLAVLASDLPGRSEVVNREACGLVVAPGRDGHLAGVRRLLADRDAVGAMGARGREAVAARYSWRVAEAALLHFYRRLSAGPYAGADEPPKQA
jgi:glycosyltransferase involved in cell wall biosynthesis